MTTKKFVYRAIQARQSAVHRVLSFPARARDIKAFADIDHAGRAEDGTLKGFQRPQIASHIKDIRHYLSHRDAVLPNPIVIAFTQGVQVREVDAPFVELEIDSTHGLPGFVVDGQQRLSALNGLEEKDFEVFVSALICENYEELRRQFILINNTRPLPKALIYELLPSVSDLPQQFSSRSFAAALTEKLNFQKSSLKGLIYQHTNPTGVIRDTAIQKVIMTSAENGALREISSGPGAAENAFEVINHYYEAVQRTFPEDWEGHTPKTSRLIHGAGIRAMGYVMDLLWERNGARDRRDFRDGLACLKGHTAWTSGTWKFGENEVVPWNAIQNIDRQINGLAHYLVNVVRRSEKPRVNRLAVQ
jgi:DGQHR domain-containing protein